MPLVKAERGRHRKRSGVERRNRGGVGRPSRSEPAPAWLLRRRHPHRRRFAWLARARALRYSPADGRRRAIASGDPRSNQTQRTDRSAAGLGRGAMAHGGRQRGGWTDQCTATDPGAVQPARDGRVTHGYPYRSDPQARSHAVRPLPQDGPRGLPHHVSREAAVFEVMLTRGYSGTRAGAFIIPIPGAIAGIVTETSRVWVADRVGCRHDPAQLSPRSLPARDYPARDLAIPPLHVELPRRRGTACRARGRDLL